MSYMQGTSGAFKKGTAFSQFKGGSPALQTTGGYGAAPGGGFGMPKMASPASAMGALKKMGAPVQGPGGWQKVGQSWVTGDQAMALAKKNPGLGQKLGVQQPQGPSWGDQVNAAGWADYQNADKAQKFNYQQNQQALQKAQQGNQQAAAGMQQSGQQFYEEMAGADGQGGVAKGLRDEGNKNYGEVKDYVGQMNADVKGMQDDAYGEMQKGIDNYQDMTALNMGNQAQQMAQGLQQQLQQINSDPNMTPEMRQSAMEQARQGHAVQMQQAMVPLSNQFNESLAQMRQSFAGMKLQGAGQYGQTAASGGGMLVEAGRQKQAAWESSAGYIQAGAQLRNASQMAAQQMLAQGDQMAYENQLRNPYGATSMLDMFLTLGSAQNAFKSQPISPYGEGLMGMMG